MENYFLDCRRSDRKKLGKLKAHLGNQISSRSCIIMGSAPNPTLPQVEDSLVVCVNGSVHSAQQYLGRSPILTFLNGAIFKNTDTYSNATLRVLEDSALGTLLIARNAYDTAKVTLSELRASYTEAFSVSKYDKRVILAESCGKGFLGTYPFDANVSNGLFVAALALWAGAREAILTGFSFNSKHAYSTDVALSKRGHLEEDRLFLEYIGRSTLPIYTAEKEILESFAIKRWPSA